MIVPVLSGRLYAPHGHAAYIFNESEYPDPDTAPAWPTFTSDRGDLKGVKKYLHTSEIHTFFEYRGDEEFEFSGDDDVWVYINGIMAINLRGHHSAVTQSIDLSSPFAREYLNITDILGVDCA